MARSGFKRGLVFYSIDLVGFAAAVVAAVRFHEIPATFLDAIGLSPRVASVAGGLAIFAPLIVATAVVGARVSRAVYKPGLFTTNRILGAAFAAALAVAVVVVGLLFAQAARLPFGIGGLIDRSVIAPQVIETTAPAIAAVDDRLGLDLCGGRLARGLPELCDAET